MIHRYKVSWSLWNMGEAVSKPIVTLQNKIKMGLTTVAGCTYVMSNADYTLIILLSGFLIDLSLSCIDLEEIEITPNK